MNRSFRTIRVEIDHRGVATVTLNRPDKRNAFDEVMIAELDEAARCLGGDPAVRVAVLAGAGAAFCAGGDIGWFARTAELAREERVRQSAALATMLSRLDRLPMPLIGRVNGAAFGGGVGLVAVCDLAVASDEARFALSEVRLGLVPANISPYVVARIGVASSRAVMLSGAPFDAARAESLGLVARAVPAGELDDAVEELVAAHLEAAPGAVAATKQLIRDVAGRDGAEVMSLTAACLADAWESEEGRAGIRAFLDRTTPPWRRR